MNSFLNKDGKPVLLQMVKGIQENKDYLAEVDGLIGDGDHGMNMNKGFTVFEARFAAEDYSFTDGLEKLGTVLMNEIGGSMGRSTEHCFWKWRMPALTPNQYP